MVHDVLEAISLVVRSWCIAYLDKYIANAQRLRNVDVYAVCCLSVRGYGCVGFREVIYP
jgi:hypothetical protein